ncbi:immune-related protein 1 [Plakobranchus ocellatus]|uniref:Immune-related protein 1 n=1 Tax=Plakobranchus ocellatus TaxID=259542 RepID=A0AAV3YE18_9GAST|nr:immune-related protein 1 [Plakobranchus ocellatus]
MQPCSQCLNQQTQLQHRMTILLAASVLTLVLLAVSTDARPEGSPFSACQSMLPAHGANSARQDLSPYVVLVSQAAYNPGDTVSVMLRGLCSIEFMGFLVQARRADPEDPRMRQDPYEAIGSFSAVMGTRYECGDVSKISVGR